MIDIKGVGKSIADLRRKRGLTQESMAKMMNVAGQLVAAWEKGDLLPDTKLLPELSYTLGTSIDTLLLGNYTVRQPGGCGGSIIIAEDFSSFDASKWEDAVYIPWFTGRPQLITVSELEGHKALYLQSSEVSSWKRRGIGLAAPVDLSSSMILELSFRPSGDLDGMLELWLFNKQTSNFLRVGVRAGCYGEERVVTAEVSGHEGITSPKVFEWGEWLTFQIEILKDRTIIALLNLKRKILWRYCFEIPLQTLFDNFNIVLSQELGSPGGSQEWHMKAYIDRLVLASSMLEV